MPYAVLHAIIGTQEMLIIFAALVPVAVVYMLIKSLLKGYRQSWK